MPGARAELSELAEQLSGSLQDVLSKADVRDRYKSEPGDAVVIVSADPWEWVFPPEVLPARRTARELLDRWLELARRVLRASAPETEAEFCRRAPRLRSPLDFSEAAAGPGSREPTGAAAYVLEALAEQRALLQRVLGSALDADGGELWLVPDTNALYKNPSLELWAHDESATLVLVPQVLRELDGHKQHHPVEDVRRKAQGLLRRFEEYARRGDTLVGVPIAGSLRFREVAVDADVGESLSWLRSGHADDQLLASVLDLRWSHPANAVTLVTEDRGLRNKARMAVVVTSPAPPPPPPPPETVKTGDPRKRPARARIRVKLVNAVREELPAPPLYQGTAPTSVLVVEVLNGGGETAFDVRGELHFHSSGGARSYLGRLVIPVLEVNGTFEHRFPQLSPGWPAWVGPRDVSIENGAWTDGDGVDHPID